MEVPALRFESELETLESSESLGGGEGGLGGGGGDLSLGFAAGLNLIKFSQINVRKGGWT